MSQTWLWKEISVHIWGEIAWSEFEVLLQYTNTWSKYYYRILQYLWERFEIELNFWELHWNICNCEVQFVEYIKSKSFFHILNSDDVISRNLCVCSVYTNTRTRTHTRQQNNTHKLYFVVGCWFLMTGKNYRAKWTEINFHISLFFLLR